MLLLEGLVKHTALMRIIMRRRERRRGKIPAPGGIRAHGLVMSSFQPERADHKHENIKYL